MVHIYCHFYFLLALIMCVTVFTVRSSINNRGKINNKWGQRPIVSNIGSYDRGQALINFNYLINSVFRDITNNGKFRTHWFRRLVSNPH